PAPGLPLPGNPAPRHVHPRRPPEGGRLCGAGTATRGSRTALPAGGCRPRAPPAVRRPHALGPGMRRPRPAATDAADARRRLTSPAGRRRQLHLFMRRSPMPAPTPDFAARLLGRERYLFLEEQAADADRLFLKLVVVLAAISVGIAAFTGHWGAALWVSLPTVAFAAAQVHFFLGTRLSRISIALAMMALSAALIHQSNGMTEAHFGVIMLIALLLYYRDWLPIVVAAAAIAVHHVAFFFMQRAGLPFPVYPPGAGFGIVLLHAAYVTVETVLLTVMAVQMRRQLLSLGYGPRRLARLANDVAQEQPVPAEVAAMDFPPASLASALVTMSGQLMSRLQSGHAVSREHLRIRAALDSVTTNVMVTDASRRI